MAKKKENLQVQNNVDGLEEKTELVEALEAVTEIVPTVVDVSSDVLAPPSLTVLEEEIEDIKSKARGVITACEAYARQACFEIGKRLLVARDSVPKGEYYSFLEKVGYDPHTASNLVRIYKEMGSDETFSNLSYSQMIALLPLPLEQRKVLAPEIEDKSKREIDRLVKELKAAEAAKEEAEAAKASAMAAQSRAENAQAEAEKAQKDAEFLLTRKEEELAEANKKRVEHYAAKTDAEAALKAAKKKAREQASKSVTLLDKAKEENEAQAAKIAELSAIVEGGGKREWTSEEVAAFRQEIEEELSAKQAKEAARTSPALVELNIVLEDLQLKFFRISELIKQLSGEQKEKALGFAVNIIQRSIAQNGLIV